MKDLTLMEAIGLFSTLGLEVSHAHHDGLERAAKVVEKQAKAYIGTYDARPVWPELAERTKSERSRLGFSDNEPLLRTGELRDSIEHTVSHMPGLVGDLEAQIGSNNQKAVWHELGTSKAPPRPFLEPAMKAKIDEILEVIGVAVHGHLSGTKRSS